MRRSIRDREPHTGTPAVVFEQTGCSGRGDAPNGRLLIEQQPVTRRLRHCRASMVARDALAPAGSGQRARAKAFRFIHRDPHPCPIPETIQGQEPSSKSIARNAMRTYGLEPDFPAAARAQLAHFNRSRRTGCAICERWRGRRSTTTTRAISIRSRSATSDGGSASTVLVAIADVDGLVPRRSPLDEHAAREHDVGLYPGADLPDAAAGAVDRSNVAQRGRRGRRSSSK